MCTIHTHTALSILDRQPYIPEDIPEDVPVFTRSPAKPSRSFKRSPLSSQSHSPQNTPPEQRAMPVLASSVPTESRLSNGSPDIPIVRTRSSGSAKSLDKPPPPPKPSTLTRKPKPTSSEGAAPQMVSTAVNAGNQSKNDEGSSTPSEAANVKTNDQAVSKVGPPKPMRKSIKRGGVTEQVRKELEDKSLTSRAGNVPPSSNEEKIVPTKTDDPSLSQGSSDSHTPSVTPPPPKPSRNYKSIKILTRPPDKPALSDNPLVKNITDVASGENIKPSELLRRSRSPATESPDHTPSLSQGSGNSQEDRPLPKTRTSAKKPSLPSKPPRKSIKLKTAN